MNPGLYEVVPNGSHDPRSQHSGMIVPLLQRDNMFHVMGHPGAYKGDGAVATTLKLSHSSISKPHASTLHVLESILVNLFENDCSFS